MLIENAVVCFGIDFCRDRFEWIRNWRQNKAMRKKLQNKREYVTEVEEKMNKEDSENQEIIYTSSEDLLEQQFQRLEKQ